MSIFKDVFGDPLLDKLDEKIDNITSKITSDSTITTGLTGEDALGDVIEDFIENNKEYLDTLFSGVTVSTDRLERYSVYEDIYRSTPLIKRVFKVYRSNLLQKNPVTGEFITYSRAADSVDKQKFDSAKQLCKKIVTYFDLLKKLKYRITFLHFLYGDCYLEIFDISEKTKEDVYSKLTTITDSAYDDIIRTGNRDTLLSVLENVLFIEQRSIDSELLYEAEQPENDDVDLRNAVYYIHSPKNIVKLVTKYGTCVGYLEVLNTGPSYSDNAPISTRISQVISRLSRLSGGSSTVDEQSIVDRLFARFLTKLLSSNNVNNSRNVVASLDEDVFKFIRKIVYEHTPHRKSRFTPVTVRFIPVSRMVEFQTPSAEYFPYGDSLVDPLVLPSKLYLISQLSNIVLKLSRASLIRKWIIDAGPFRQHRGLIEKLRRELYNTRVTLDSISNYKSLVNILSDFKDLYIISKEGRRPIDVEVQSMGDPSVKVADLEDARRELLLLSGVPPQYVGYDVAELREQLVQTNIIFANEIVDMQESYNSALRRLMDITAKIVGYNEADRISDIVTVSLIPPVGFIAQLIEMTLGTVGNIANIFQGLNADFDPYYFLEKYVPYVDWEEFRQHAEQYVRSRNIKNSVGGGQQSGY